MSQNPLVGYAAVFPDDEFLCASDCVLVLGVSRRKWFRAYLDSSGRGECTLMPIYVAYLEVAIPAGLKGVFALDIEALRVFEPFAVARGFRPCGVLRPSSSSSSRSEGAILVEGECTCYGRRVGLN